MLDDGLNVRTKNRTSVRMTQKYNRDI
jgi:hypothetical protein